MDNIEFEKKLETQNYIEKVFIEETFNFWFNGNEHIRSPFPEYMRMELKNKSSLQFLDWTLAISEKAKKDINDEILAEKFEEIIFEIALDLAKTEDEKISIRYPFLPRIGDNIQVKDVPEEQAESIVINRSVEKKGDNAFLKVTLENASIKKIWETEFELPE